MFFKTLIFVIISGACVTQMMPLNGAVGPQEDACSPSPSRSPSAPGSPEQPHFPDDGSDEAGHVPNAEMSWPESLGSPAIPLSARLSRDGEVADADADAYASTACSIVSSREDLNSPFVTMGVGRSKAKDCFSDFSAPELSMLRRREVTLQNIGPVLDLSFLRAALTKEISGKRLQEARISQISIKPFDCQKSLNPITVKPGVFLIKPLVTVPHRPTRPRVQMPSTPVVQAILQGAPDRGAGMVMRGVPTHAITVRSDDIRSGVEENSEIDEDEACCGCAGDPGCRVS